MQVIIPFTTIKGVIAFLAKDNVIASPAQKSVITTATTTFNTQLCDCLLYTSDAADE